MARKNKMPHMEKTKEHLYNAQGSPEAGEAMDEEPGFKRGGKAKKHAKRKHGGKADGEEGKRRADKAKRGGHMHHKRASGGRTPYSTGSKTSEPKEAGKTNLGHEGERPEG